ncbi:MAG: polymer-forming cytoskeletal protein [Pseudomonadota bacterium]
MFSKNKITDTPAPGDKPAAPAAVRPEPARTPAPAAEKPVAPAFPAKPKPSPSLLSSDLTVTGNVVTSGDIQIEGQVEGDVRAHLLTVGEGAVIKGEIVAEDVVVNGKVVGRVRGLKVRLTASAVVEGDIVHKTIAIESGAHFEGSVQRNEDPLNQGSSTPVRSPAAPAPPAAPAAATGSD